MLTDQTHSTPSTKRKDVVRVSYFILLSLLAISCGQQEAPLTDTPPAQDWTMVDSLPPVGSWYSNTLKIVTLEDISGKAFSFAPDIDTAKFEPNGECDCCMDDLFFIDDSSFIRIYYCMSDQSICSGSYKITSAGIELVYDSTVVNKTYDEEMYDAGIDMGEDMYTVETSYMNEPFSEILTAWEFKNSFFLKNDGKNIYYGIESIKTDIKAEIEFLRVDGVWDLISMQHDH